MTKSYFRLGIYLASAIALAELALFAYLLTQREIAPPYKKTLRRAALVVIVAVAVISAVNDIYQLANP